MNGREADMVMTDPPYNVNYEGGTGLKIMNDKMSNNSFYNISKSGKSTHNFVIIGAFSKLFDSI